MGRITIWIEPIRFPRIERVFTRVAALSVGRATDSELSRAADNNLFGGEIIQQQIDKILPREGIAAENYTAHYSLSIQISELGMQLCADYPERGADTPGTRGQNFF
jgi:hypothetical protein